MLSSFVKGTTETCCGFKTFQATDGRVPLLDATVVLLQTIIEGCVGPMRHLTSHGFAYGTGRATMSVCRDLFWSRANNGNGLLKEPFCSIPLSFLAQPRIN